MNTHSEQDDLDMLIDAEMDIDDVVVHDHDHDININSRPLDEEGGIGSKTALDALGEDLMGGSVITKRSSIFNVVYHPPDS